jgi:hypothetical protein
MKRLLLLFLLVGCSSGSDCIHTRNGPHDTPVIDGVKAPLSDGGAE